jgi:hypothetical protein
MNRNIDILIDRAATHTHRTDKIALRIENRLPTAEYNGAPVRLLDAKDIAARLAPVQQRVVRDSVVQDHGLRLFLADVDAPKECVVHVDEADQEGRGVEHRDVLLDAVDWK